MERPDDLPPQAPADPFAPLRLDNRFARLDDGLFVRHAPVPLPEPRLLALSAPAAALLGLDPAALAGPRGVAVLAGNAPLPGGKPLASLYGGHRSGRWAGRLGDREALLLGEAVAANGQHWEIRLEGTGPTPYARPGEGRIGLDAAVRAFLCAEALHGLGIPTSRALAVVGSGAPPATAVAAGAQASGAATSAPLLVAQGDAPPAPAVLAQLAPGFVRFGHFEHFHYTGRHDLLRRLADHVLETGYPELRGQPRPYLALLREVTLRTARLVAAWQAVGFCHGAMHTDAMSMLGLTLDHGAAGFFDGFDAHRSRDPADEAGRHAYGAQPGVGEWNCYALGRAMLPLLGSADEAESALAPYRRSFADELERLLRAKLGLREPGAADRSLFDRLFALLHESRVDFTLFFRRLARLRADDALGDEACRALCADPAAFDAWAADYRRRLRQEGVDDRERAAAMLRANPKYVLRDGLVAQAIRSAGDRPHDSGGIARLQALLARPFDEQPEHEGYAGPPSATLAAAPGAVPPEVRPS